MHQECTKSWKKTLPKAETLALRNKYIGSSCQLHYKNDPIKIVSGQGQYMYDETGKRYLDCINNVSHVGHGHSYVADACSDQMRVLSTNSRFLHDNILMLAKRLTDTLPKELSTCYFVNSGSEANDLALRLALYATKNKDIITIDHAYYGHLSSLINISPYRLYYPGCEEKKPDYVHIVPVPDRYRGKYRDDQYDECQLAELYSNEIKNVCNELKSKGKGVSAFIAESMQSCGGQVILPKNYLSLVYKYVREAGGVCIADEVQSGFGRVGTSMWSFQTYDSIVPDIVTIGKPMGNGYPIAAVITTQEIASAFRRGPDYFNTYGGNPVACAVGLAVLDIMEKEQLQENAVKVGNFVIEELKSFKTKYSFIGDVRGRGMFIGIDLVSDLKTRDPLAKDIVDSILWKMRERGILLSRDGPFENILKFKPPMCFNIDDAKFMLKALDEVFSEVEQNDMFKNDLNQQ